MKRFVLLLSFFLALPAFAGSLQPLDAAGVPALVKPPAHGVRVVALWALDCAYCEENLSALAKLAGSGKSIEFIAVATDPVSQSDAIRARLHTAALDKVDARAYTDVTPDRINYLIDPEWGGETPRTLVIRADGSRKAYSGALDAKRLAEIAAL
jgi:hypothetical protein